MFRDLPRQKPNAAGAAEKRVLSMRHVMPICTRMCRIYLVCICVNVIFLQITDGYVYRGLVFESRRYIDAKPSDICHKRQLDWHGKIS